MKRLRDTNYGTGNPAGEGLGGRRREKRTDRRRSRKAPTRPIRVLGIVGGMGSGKSRIAKMLAVRGATVIDADAVGHALLDQGPVQEALVRKFGTDILGPDLGDGTRQIDRRALGAIVFSNEAARKALEESLHPRMRTTFERVISRLSRQVSPKPGSLRLPAPIVVLDAALLYEAGWNDLCDMVVFVDPRKSKIDIAQAAGRAMRQSKATNKKLGYIVVPLFIEQKKGETEAGALARSGFDEVAMV